MVLEWADEPAYIPKPVSYKRHRSPPEIIARAVWLYFRFPLSLRLVEEMLLERSIIVSYEAIRVGLCSPPQAQDAEPP
jgi:putative transposase